MGRCHKIREHGRRFIFLLILIYLFTGCTSTSRKCNVEGCQYSAIQGGDYCNSHTCKPIAVTNSVRQIVRIAWNIPVK